MYALIHQVGESFEVLAVSESEATLSERLKNEVLAFIDEVYDNDEEALGWLMPVSQGMTYWSDEDEEYPTTYRIDETELI